MPIDRKVSILGSSRYTIDTYRVHLRPFRPGQDVEAVVPGKRVGPSSRDFPEARHEERVGRRDTGQPGHHWSRREAGGDG